MCRGASVFDYRNGALALLGLALSWAALGGCQADGGMQPSPSELDAGTDGASPSDMDEPDAAAEGGSMPYTGAQRPDAGAQACAPEVDGSRSVLEGDTLELAVGCSLESADPSLTFEPEGLPEGASFDVDAATLTWQPGLDQAGVHRFAFGVAGLAERTEVEVHVIDRWDDPGNVGVDPTTYLEEYGLPVIHLGVSEDLNFDAHTPATLTYRGYTYTGVEAKHRGNTSRRFPKRCYTIKFDKQDEFQDERYGFADKRRIVLTTTFDDNSYLRQRLAYELWNRLDPEHVQIAVYNAVVFVNGSYEGLYLVSDHVDDELMAANGLWKGGNLYKAREHTANFKLTDAAGNLKDPPHLGYTKEEGAPAAEQPDAYADLDALITWVATASDEEFYAGVDARLARKEFEDWWIFVIATEAVDSAGKNHYVYHDPRPDADDPRFHYIPWDFNASFGQTWKTHRLDPTGGFNAAKRNYVFERLLADPRFAEPLHQRFDEVLHTTYEVDEVLALFDAWVEEIDASARRDEGRWGETFARFDWEGREEFTVYEEEIEYVRGWIRAHWAHLDGLY